MTGSDQRVVFDSWAWVEFFDGTARGLKMRAYVERGQVVTPATAITEVVGKAWRNGATWQEADAIANGIRQMSEIQPLDDDIAALAAQLSVHLRKRDPQASYADAIMLATARTLALPLISNDMAFANSPDVHAE